MNSPLALNYYCLLENLKNLVVGPDAVTHARWNAGFLRRRRSVSFTNAASNRFGTTASRNEQKKNLANLPINHAGLDKYKWFVFEFAKHQKSGRKKCQSKSFNFVKCVQIEIRMHTNSTPAHINLKDAAHENVWCIDGVPRVTSCFSCWFAHN